ncbi:MAG TPA: Calx-beta domain-containing protein, partial [Verrucomicrobiota bacterium]|nr:Calx-beta domain-containing protein [Verrucomicrobiota bacterium]
GTATRDVDYELASGVLQFVHLDPDADNPFENRIALIPLTILDDDLPELDETVVVRLRLAGTTNAPAEPGPGDPIDTNGDGVFDACDTDGDGVPDVVGECPGGTPAVVVFNGLPDVYLVHTLTILDDDRGTVGVTAGASAVPEGGPPGEFIIRRTGTLPGPLTVILQVHGTAVAGADFAPLPSFVTFAPGQAEVVLPVIPFDDPEQEYLEDIRLTLLRAPGYRIAPATARMLLEDNDGTIEFLTREYRANEADGFAEIRVRRTSDTNVAATVAYEAVAGTARPGAAPDDPAGDFLPVNGLLEFLPGEAVKGFLVPLINSTNVNALPRTVLLRLTRATGLFPLGGQSTATLFILDDDSAEPADIQIAGRTTDFEQGGSAALVLTRLRDVENPLTLLYYTRDGTAFAGEDYEPEPAGLLAFGEGEATAEINVRFIDDAVVEEDETFEIVITDASGFELVAVPVLILNDDTEIEFALAEQEVREDAGVVEVVVRRRGFVAPAMLVDYATTNLTALAGLDYEAAAGTLTFLGNRTGTATDGSGAVFDLPGETVQTITIRIINDDLGELDEQFLVGLASPRREQPGLGTISLGPVNPAVITILDNEAPGELDESFNPGLGTDGLVRALAVQEDGRVILGGDFGTVNGTVLPRLARLHTDGLVDTSFNPGRGLDAPVHAVAVLRDGRVLAGGVFTNAGLVQRRFLARFEADGPSPPGTNNVPAPTAIVGPLAGLRDGG